MILSILAFLLSAWLLFSIIKIAIKVAWCLNGMTEVTAFTIGFKLGLRLTAEAFIGSDQKLDV